MPVNALQSAKYVAETPLRRTQLSPTKKQDLANKKIEVGTGKEDPAKAQDTQIRKMTDITQSGPTQLSSKVNLVT